MCVCVWAGGAGGGTWVNFCRVCAAGLSEPLPHYSLFCGHLSHLWANTSVCAIPTTSAFHLCTYPISNEENFTFHLQYKHSGTFANRKYEELSYPKIRKCALVTLLKMRPHYSQSSCENATSSGGIFQLASYKEVPLGL